MGHPKQFSDYNTESVPFWVKGITAHLDNVPTTTQILSLSPGPEAGGKGKPALQGCPCGGP